MLNWGNEVISGPCVGFDRFFYPGFAGFESLGLVKLAVGIWGFAFRPGFDICTYPGNGFIIADANFPLTIIILMVNGYGVLRTPYFVQGYVVCNK